MGDFRRYERLDTEGIAVNAIALPAAFFFAWVLNAMGMWILAGYLFQANAHESGHTIVSWLSSRFAMMIPIGLTITSLEKSLGVGLVVFAVLGALVAWGVLERRIWAIATGGVILVVAVVLTFVVSNEKSIEWVVFGGCAGEIVLSALGVASFYVTLPDRLRWDFWRFFVLVLSACTFLFADRQWRAVSRNLTLLPTGTALSSSNDSNGDMNKLLRAGWTSESIANAYVGIADVAWVAIGVLYTVRVVRALRRREG